MNLFQNMFPNHAFPSSRRCILFKLFQCLTAMMLSVWASAAEAPVRFLLTFDDGPSLWQSAPTAQVLQQLAHNPVTPAIKGIFFVQTAHVAHGGSDAGRTLIQQTCTAGHLVELHSGTPRGHIPHVRMAPDELMASLESGKQAIDALCAGHSDLLRPPDWAYNDETLAAYHSAHLDMLLTDISANDGKIYGWTISLRRRQHFRQELELVAQSRAAGKLPSLDGAMPIVVTFHDVNPYTAAHMSEYLQILVEESAAIGLPLADPPFYTDNAALYRAAHLRAGNLAYVCDGVALSVPLLRRIFGGREELRRGCV